MKKFILFSIVLIIIISICIIIYLTGKNSEPNVNIIQNETSNVSDTQYDISSDDLNLLYNQVKSTGPFDYKDPDVWKATIKKSFLGYDGKFLWDGQMLTAENFTNMNYGIVCTAMGYSPTKIHYLFGEVLKELGEKMDINSMISTFDKNGELFNQVIEELEGNEEIYIRKNDADISIYTYVLENDEYTKEEINKEEFYKYENTIKLMNDCNLLRIAKENGNVSFLFNTMFQFAQYIVKMNNEEKYRWAYSVIDIQKINDNNWYYVETK